MLKNTMIVIIILLFAQFLTAERISTVWSFCYDVDEEIKAYEIVRSFDESYIIIASKEIGEDLYQPILINISDNGELLSAVDVDITYSGEKKLNLAHNYRHTYVISVGVDLFKCGEDGEVLWIFENEGYCDEILDVFVQFDDKIVITKGPFGIVQMINDNGNLSWTYESEFPGESCNYYDIIYNYPNLVFSGTGIHFEPYNEQPYFTVLALTSDGEPAWDSEVGIEITYPNPNVKIILASSYYYAISSYRIFRLGFNGSVYSTQNINYLLRDFIISGDGSIWAAGDEFYLLSDEYEMQIEDSIEYEFDALTCNYADNPIGLYSSDGNVYIVSLNSAVDAEDELQIPDNSIYASPNPFYLTGNNRGVTTISFSCDEIESAKLEIFDIKGKEIISFDSNDFISSKESSNRYNLQWNGCDRFGNNVTSGVYLYQFTTENQVIANKMIILK